MATMLKTVTTAAAFPAADVEACIRDALQDQADTQAILRPPLPGAPSAGPGWEPEIDSLAVVEIICSIEELLGVTLPASFVPRGGYERAEACVQDLLKAAQDVWDEATNEEVEHA
jgi:hypothetical protein